MRKIVLSNSEFFRRERPGNRSGHGAFPQMTLRIANAAGFWGDWTLAPQQLISQEKVDFLTLEYLAELTLSIMARQREKNPTYGYARDFINVIDRIIPELQNQSSLKIVTNAGGLNPPSCAAALGQLLTRCGMGSIPIGVVTGDDLLEESGGLADRPWPHFDTHAPLDKRADRTVSANAYLGAKPICEALQQGSRIVVTGRVADASLTVGPTMHHYGWDWEDWDRLAAASVAGHLIECGAQVTGGYRTDWRDASLGRIGYPLVEIAEDGQFTVTKPEASGGAVTRQSVIEQIVYEIGDPSAYITPDVIVDFTKLEVAAIGTDRVAVRNAHGKPRPEALKVSLAYADGFMASGQLLVYGKDCIVKARIVADLITERLRQEGIELDRFHVELLGAGDGVPGMVPPPDGLHEVVLRISATDPDRASLEAFARQFAPLITNGPAGLSGYAQGRPVVRSIYSYWPTTVSRAEITPKVTVQTADEWAATEST